MKLETFFTSIADKMRELLGTVEKIKPKNFVSKLTEIFNAGKKSEYDAFWDAFQSKGKRYIYTYAFCNDWLYSNNEEFNKAGWSVDTFKPKYDINIMLGAQAYVFGYCKVRGSLKEILKNQGIALNFTPYKTNPNTTPKYDTSGAGYIFYESQFTELPTLDLSEAGGKYVFDASFTNMPYCETIEKIILPTAKTGLTSYGTKDIFSGALKNLTLEGTIYFNFRCSKAKSLSADSMLNIFNCLDTTASSTTRTLTIPTATKTRYDEKYGDWDTKVAYYSTNGNWTFSIV